MREKSKNKVNQWLVFLIIIVFMIFRKLAFPLLMLCIAGLIGGLSAEWYLKRKTINEGIIK